MKAIRVHQFGGPDELSHDEVPVPEPGCGEARVRTEVIGVNFTDVNLRKGRQGGDLPSTIGVEAAGIVDAVGPDVTVVAPGERVVYATERGSYAEYSIVPAWKLVQIPDVLRSQEAAAIMLQGLTAHYLTQSTYMLQPGETALVHAAAGGVGLLLVQMAKQRSARVIGTASTEEKAHVAKEAGADEVIVYTGCDFEAEVRRLMEGRGVNVVYDSVGKTTFQKGLNCLKARGCMVIYGESSGPAPDLDSRILSAKGSLFLTRPSLAHHMSSRSELLERTSDLFEMLSSSKLQVRIDRVFPLSAARDAHEYLESRQSKGKLLLMP